MHIIIGLFTETLIPKIPFLFEITENTVSSFYSKHMLANQCDSIHVLHAYFKSVINHYISIESYVKKPQNAKAPQYWS